MNMDFTDMLEVHSDWKLHISPLNTSHSACTHLPLTVKLYSHSSVLLMWAVGLVGLCYATQVITEWCNILGLNLFKQAPNLIRFEILQMICDVKFSIVLNNLEVEAIAPSHLDTTSVCPREHEFWKE